MLGVQVVAVYGETYFLMKKKMEFKNCRSFLKNRIFQVAWFDRKWRNTKPLTILENDFSISSIRIKQITAKSQNSQNIYRRQLYIRFNENDVNEVK